MRIAIIGMGNMGSKYAKYIKEDSSFNMTLVAVTRPKRDKELFVSEYIKDVLVYDNDKELFKALDNKEFEIDSIIVATPHYSHKDIVIEAFKRNLNVLCEKPAGVFLKDARIMNEANTNNLLYGLVFHQRTYSIYQYLYKIIKEEKYGKLQRVNYITTDWFRTNDYYKKDSWRSTYKTDGGGTLLNQCPHSLDLLCFLFGMPSKVMAFCNEGKYHDIEVEDEVSSYLEWDNGVTGIFIASTGENPGINRMEVTTSRAQITVYKEYIEIKYNDFDSEYYIKNNIDNSKITPMVERIDFKYDSSQKEVLRMFGNNRVICNGKEALMSLYLSNAMYLSSFKKKIVNIYPISSKEELEFELEFIDEFNKRI